MKGQAGVPQLQIIHISEQWGVTKSNADELKNMLAERVVHLQWLLLMVSPQLYERSSNVFFSVKEIRLQRVLTFVWSSQNDGIIGMKWGRS